MAEYEIVIKMPDGGFKRIWAKKLILQDDVLLENDELIIAANETRVSRTFVKCKCNEYGKKGVCQAKEIQIGGAAHQGQHDVEPVCVHYCAELVDAKSEVTECFWCGERMARLRNGQSICPQCGWRYEGK